VPGAESDAMAPDTDDPHRIADLAALTARYGAPGITSLAKEVDHVHPHYGAIIAKAPFAVLATVGPDGLDASPRGDPPGFVVVEDPKTLLMPDRRGNNRIDSLRNIVADPRVALLFMIPGVGETLRVNGRATLRTDPALLARFAVDGRLPTCVLRIAVETVFFQCARAIKRAQLWDPARHVARDTLPSPGTVLAELSGQQVDGARYDGELQARQAATLY
jgi:PPOX class probable FMN-dependent enzyme